MTKETLQALRNSGSIYDYVANNYTCMDRSDLKEIISELVWVGGRNLSDFEQQVLDSIEENCLDED